MVKVEDSDESEQSSPIIPVDRTIPKIEKSYVNEINPIVQKQIDVPSSSNNQLKAHFVGMGFSRVLVDKVIKELGEGDPNMLLEALFAHSALKNPKLETSEDELSFSNDDDVGSPLVFMSDEEETKEKTANDSLDKMAYLLMMDFSEKEVQTALNHLGESAPLTKLVDFIIDNQTGFAMNWEKNNEEIMTESLFGTMDKTICLLKMGFTEDEISSSIAHLGSDVSVRKLAESILASRLGHKVIKEEVQDMFNRETLPNEGCSSGLGYSSYGADSKLPRSTFSFKDEIRGFKQRYSSPVMESKVPRSTLTPHDEIGGNKRAKHAHLNSGRSWIKDETIDELASSIKEEMMEHLGMSYAPRRIQGVPNRPFFLYGNVIDIPMEMWRRLSQFIHNIEPEFLNSQFFSAFIRKEGYIHNLPTENRFHILPKPPTTIEDALPHTKRWWPSWDTRKQLTCFGSDIENFTDTCERLGKMMKESQGVLSREQQMDILHHCKISNLLWSGPNKLSPIGPDHLEHILGYPDQHTDIWGLQPFDRLKALKWSFQTDTIGYLLSVLKGMYPDGLRVLSIFTGIGGILVALHRLRIHLKCVVAIEAVENNRKILKSWWQRSGQSGELDLIPNVAMLTIQKLDGLRNRFGGFDIVVGSNPGSAATESFAGIDNNQFFEFVRVIQRVRNMMGSSSSS